MKDLKTLISEYLEDAEIMQLATGGENGQPWICTLHFALGENGSMYWNSLRDRRHSQEVRANGKVAVAVLKDPAVTRALQMEGDAEEVTGEAVHEAHRIYSAAHGDSPKRLEYALSDASDDPAYYVFRPRNIVLFDKVNFPDDPRQEIPSTALSSPKR